MADYHEYPHWLDAATMLNKAAKDLKSAGLAGESVGPDSPRVQAFLRSAQHNINAAMARFYADIKETK